MHGSCTSCTDVIGTGTDGSALADNKVFIFEECRPRMASEVTYTAGGRNVASVKDIRGFTVTSHYDADNRLLEGVTDAKGNRVSYTYNAQNDRLTGVSLDGAADGFMTGGLCALGGSVIGGATRTIKNAKSGITIGKKGQFEKVAELAKMRHYSGLKDSIS